MRSRVVRAKKRAKVLLFFDMTKFFFKNLLKIFHFTIENTEKSPVMSDFSLRVRRAINRVAGRTRRRR